MKSSDADLPSALSAGERRAGSCGRAEAEAPSGQKLNVSVHMTQHKKRPCCIDDSKGASSVVLSKAAHMGA